MEPITGRLWRIDRSGIIVNDAHTDLIQPPFTALIEDAIRAYSDHIGGDIDSIYLTGSVARGLAVEGRSDLNAFAVLAAAVDPDLVLQDWVTDAECDLLERHPCVSDVQLELWPYYSVFTDPARFSAPAFILKTHSACLWGVDLSTQLPDYRISPAIANDDLVQLVDDLADSAEGIEADPSDDNVRSWCQFAAKSILRSGFGLVQMQEGVHTRDVDLCCAYFVQHHPAYANHMRRALHCATDPIEEAESALSFITGIGGWLIPLADEWLDQHNPARELALPVDDVEAWE
ncbi:MAG: hypothetical protein K8J31_07300 [Anaerolineae bacterium]|nr:hypothetical protein [Anaerolineae bacterium]